MVLAVLFYLRDGCSQWVFRRIKLLLQHVWLGADAVADGSRPPVLVGGEVAGRSRIPEMLGCAEGLQVLISCFLKHTYPPSARSPWRFPCSVVVSFLSPPQVPRAGP
jgi:hypothetical protein